MLEAILKIEKKIKQERLILKRESKEITIDFVNTQAGIRLKAFEESAEDIYLFIVRFYGFEPRLVS